MSKGTKLDGKKRLKGLKWTVSYIRLIFGLCHEKRRDFGLTAVANVFMNHISKSNLAV